MKAAYRLLTLGMVTGFIVLYGISAMAGTISGTAVYEGTVPAPKQIDMSEVEDCAIKHGEPVYTETLVVGEGNTLANVFIQVKSGLPDKEFPLPEEPVVLDQAGCMYSPHVFGIRAGQPLKIKNPDGTLHNVHVMPKVNQEFNIAMPKFKKTSTKVFDKPEAAFPIKCDVHSWMGAWCFVMSHPYFSVTQKDGTFSIEGLAAGTYEIEAWHEKLGVQTTTVTIAADETKAADFTFSGSAN